MLTRGSKIEIHMNKKSINALKDKDRTVVILGSKGFFEGIDVPGDGLNCVMLDKLPNYILIIQYLEQLENIKTNSIEM